MTQLTKFGVILDDLTMSQKTFLAITQINKRVQEDLSFDAVIFTKNMAIPCIRPKCANVFIQEIAHYDGMLIATDLDSAMIMIKSVNRAKKAFYVWDLEWIRRSKDFLENMNVYRSPEIKLVARSETHAKEIEKYSGRKVEAVVDDFNLDKLLELYK